MYIAFDCGHEDFAFYTYLRGLFIGFKEGREIGYSGLHHPCALDHLWQKHFSLAKQFAHDIHPIHQRTFDHFKRTFVLQPCFFGVDFDIFCDAANQGMFQSFLDIFLAPRLFALNDFA